ncbi:hypothetical protein MIR68_004486 [Amoeboaphelidium protococcarum]|nr:hypothetical protein MIR68_004486 [Amoeboaphelidium protococcarum]
MTTPTIDTLLALLKRKELNNLVDDLEEGKTTFEEMMNFTEAQWEKIAGTINGIAIYNHLHKLQSSASNVSVSVTKVTFDLYRWGARIKKGGYTTQTVELHNGRLPLKSFLQQNRLENVYLWKDDGNMTLLVYDESGFWSTTTFENSSYSLKVKETKDIDRMENFSTVTMDQVIQDFGLEDEDDNWDLHCDGSNVIFPGELEKALTLLSARHTLNAENSRRTIIELNLLFALEEVDKQKQFFILDGQLKIKVIREVGIIDDDDDDDDQSQRVEYSGPLDFAIGQSKKGAQIPHDTTLFVVEAKQKPSTFEHEGFAQVLAQAASAVCIRRKNQRGRDDYRTFWIYTDGERWCMGYVRPDLTRTNAMKYGRTAIYSASMRDFKIDKCINVYKRVVQMVRLAYNSTPRNSRADLTEEDDTDPQTIAADIVIERMKNLGIRS